MANISDKIPYVQKISKDVVPPMKPNRLNCEIFSVYDYDGMSEQELLCQFFTQIQNVTTVTNEMWDLLDYLLGIGLGIEVRKKIDEMYADGTLAEIINETIFQELNAKIDANILELDVLKNEVVRLHEQDIFDSPMHINGDKLSALMKDSDRTFYLKEGKYYLNSPAYLQGGFSLTLDDNAFIIANNPMAYMFKIYSVSNNGGMNNKNKIFRGGTFDGNYKADVCIEVEYTHDSKFTNIYVRNPLVTGIHVKGGYGATYEKIQCINDQNSLAIGENATGFILDTFDTMIFDLIISNYKLGLQVLKSANVINKVHIWCNKVSMLSQNKVVGFEDRAGFNSYSDTYCDTCNIGISIAGLNSSSTTFNNPKFTYGDNYYTSGLTPVYIVNQSSQNLYINNPFFAYTNNVNSNMVQVDSGTRDKIIYTNPTYIYPSKITNKPTDDTRKRYIKKNVLIPTTAVSGGVELSNDYDVPGLFFNDTVIINETGTFNRKLITSIIPLDDKVRVSFFNPTTELINTTQVRVYLTIIRNYDNTVLL